MNNSSSTPQQLIQKANDELAQLLIPVNVFTCICMITGLVGNVMVCFYYGFRTKRTPTSIFIVVLAVYDLIACTVTMPHEIVLSYHYFTYSNRYTCKAVQFISYFVIIASVITLPTIAVDRYRHICVSSVYKVTVTNSMKQCAIVATLALLFSWPLLIIHDIQDAPLPSKYGEGLTGTSCSRREELSTYAFVLDIIHLFFFFLCMAILVVLYYKISRVLYDHRRNLEVSETTLYSSNRGKTIDRVTARITMGMLVIAVVFFLSFIPRLSLSVWDSIVEERASDFLSNSEFVGLQFGKQSYMLNSSLNPWIYGIFNSQFRQFYYSRLCGRCRNTAVITNRKDPCSYATSTL